jgi:two-component system, cell cycle sensor histidine kinase and response regulator CckA
MAQQKESSVTPKNSLLEKPHPLHILLVEDEPTHVVILRHTIRNAIPDVTLKVISSLKEYRKIVENSTPDLVLMDLHLPDGKAIDVLTFPLEAGLFPIVVMTSSDDERTAVKAMKAGALDYIIKSTETFKSMPRIIERALLEWALIQDRKKAEIELRESEHRYRSLYENVTVGLYRTTPAGKILLANQALVKMLGYSSFEELTERNLTKSGFARPNQRKEFLRKIETEGEINNFVSTWVRQDGSLIIVMESARSVRNSNGKTLYYDGTVEDITERRLAETASKYAEDALKESEIKYHSLFDHAVEGIYYTTFEGLLINVNNALAKMLGYDSPEEIIRSVRNIGKQLYANPDDREKAITIIKEKGFLNNFEIQLKKKNGEIIWASLNGRINISQEGGILEGFITDITDRKKIEEVLRNSEEKYRGIVEQSIAGIGVSRGNQILFANKALLKIFNYDDLEEFKNRTLLDIVAPSSRKLITDRMKMVAEGKSLPLEFECDILCKNGQIKTLSASSTRMSLGGEVLTQTIFQDITERRRAEEKLEESNERFHLALESANSGIWEWNLLTNENIWSEELWRLYGLEPHSCVPSYESWQQTIHPDDRENVENKIQEAARKGNELNVEWRVIDRDGSVRWLLSRGRPLKDIHGKAINFVGIVLDISERKRAEEALHKSEEQFRTLFMSISEGFYISEAIYDDNGDPCDYRYVEVNPKFEQIIGLSREEIVGKRYKELVPDDTTQWLDNYCRVARTGISLNYEFYSKEYNRYFGTYSYSPSKGQVIVFVIDITERKQIEEALRESESQFRELWGATVEGIAILDNGIIVEVNEALCQMLGYTREYSLGKSLLEFVPAEADDQIRECIALKIEGRFEIPAVRADGKRMTLEMFAKQIIYQGKHVRMVTVRDITEQKKAEKALRENEEFFRLLFTTSPDSILIFDPFSTAVPWEILDCNEVACRMNGYTREELIGKSIDMLNTKELTPEEREAHIKRLQNKGVVYFETLHRHRDGHIFPIDVASSIFTLGGRQLILGIDRDITQRKQVEEALRQMQKMEGLGTLAGGIAHDFNNILGIILAYSTSVNRFKDDPKKLELATETIAKAVDRGKTLVQQILTFARKTETAFGAVNVNDIVMEIMTMILETFPKTLTYTQNFEKGIPHINADRTQLYQALLNLCVNARDAMPNGGMLTINTRILTGADLRPKHPDVTDNNYICIEVSDTGEGMPEEVKERIFEPFFTTKGIGKGTGLGLSVVFGVVQAHNGFIDVDSQLGKGSTFRLYLPALKVTKPNGEKEEETLGEIPGGTETLLVVEDEKMLMMSLQMVLMEKGYNILPAKDGLEALKIYQENKNEIALVLTDLGLPTITGLEVCQRIKEINSDERIVLATGYLDPDMKIEFLKAGIQNILYKPYDLKKVLRLVREVLDGKGTL